MGGMQKVPPTRICKLVPDFKIGAPDSLICVAPGIPNAAGVGGTSTQMPT